MNEESKKIEIGSEIDCEISKYDYSQCNIKYYDINEIQYDFFYAEHMLLNKPCVIQNITQSWKCSREWVKNNTINYKYFIQEYGNLNAPVANCDKINFNSQCKEDMKVKDYMSYLIDKNRHEILYLKDWHLRKISGDDTFYQVPELFASDWLNEYALDHNDDDFMFVYIGAQNTWTPFHEDVYTSYSWSVNVVGRKKWIILPPGEEEKLKDSIGNLPLLFNADEFNDVKYFEIIQEEGDAIFVPSGWHHQVFNLLDTISINHNFANACNIGAIWQALQKNLTAVEHEIEEFKETEEFHYQCQLILKSVFGMDIASFSELIIHIAHKRLNQIKGERVLLFNMYCLEKNHIEFDLKILLKIVKSILNHPLFLKNTLSQDIAPKLLYIKKSVEALNLQ